MIELSPVHPFPARMAPELAWKELDKGRGRSLRVLDPMVGSGTSLVIARKLGHQALGCDTDPLALLITSCWCADVPADELQYRAAIVVERAESIADSISAHDAFPPGADKETKKFIRYWFDRQNRKQLYALSQCISRVRDAAIRKLLWCAFSRLIITKSRGASLAMDLSHSRPHKVYDSAPIRPLSELQRSVDVMIRNAPFCDIRRAGPKVRLKYGDGRSIPFKRNSVDVVITSPPYGNAIDYIRCHKFSLVWMGNSIASLRKLRGDNIGAELSHAGKLSRAASTALARMGEVSSLQPRHEMVLKRYVADMERVLREIHRVLVTKGRAKLVLGDSEVRGVFISNSAAIQSLAKSIGFKFVSKYVRKLPENRRYLPPPVKRSAGSLDSRMREEVILTIKAA